MRLTPDNHTSMFPKVSLPISFPLVHGEVVDSLKLRVQSMLHTHASMAFDNLELTQSSTADESGLHAPHATCVAASYQVDWRN